MDEGCWVRDGVVVVLGVVVGVVRAVIAESELRLIDRLLWMDGKAYASIRRLGKRIDSTIASYNLASRRFFFDCFFFSSPDQKVNTKKPRPPLVSYGVELPDLNEISFGEENP